MQTVVIILLAVLCAILLIDMISLERGLRRGKKQIREQMEGSSTVRLNTPCPNAAAEELFETVNELLELRQAEAADYRRKEQDLRRQIADVSHDLRTPLTSILGYLQLLEDDSLPPAKRPEYTPNSVICSPNHMRNTAPAVKETTITMAAQIPSLVSRP